MTNVQKVCVWWGITKNNQTIFTQEYWQDQKFKWSLLIWFYKNKIFVSCEKSHVRNSLLTYHKNIFQIHSLPWILQRISQMLWESMKFDENERFWTFRRHSRTCSWNVCLPFPSCKVFRDCWESRYWFWQHSETHRNEKIYYYLELCWVFKVKSFLLPICLVLLRLSLRRSCEGWKTLWTTF